MLIPPRTPLHLAAFSNSVDAAKLLLKHNAKISPKMSDGRANNKYTGLTTEVVPHFISRRLTATMRS